MNIPSKKEWVIGLYGYPETPTQSATFSRFHAVVTHFLSRLGMAVTHVAAEGDGYSGKLLKANSAIAKRLTDSGFVGITVLTLVVSQEGSKEPAYDRVISASLSWNLPDELLLCVVVNESITPFQKEEFDKLLSDFIEIDNWAFGFAFCDLVERQPDFHVLSLDNGQLSKAESQALRKWYASRASERIQRLRSVYPLTIANDKQLGCNVDGGTLGEFVRRAPGTTVARIGSLTLWRVPEDQILKLRALLEAAGALIA